MTDESDGKERYVIVVSLNQDGECFSDTSIQWANLLWAVDASAMDTPPDAFMIRMDRLVMVRM